ncbi:MAG: HEAT repeat domain-containing protein [Nitrospira sp.]|nr:HEAT repeat domain-containing protein [Nitrospira sp.]
MMQNFMCKLCMPVWRIGLLFVLALSSQSCGNPDHDNPKPGLVPAPKMMITAMAGLVSLEIQNAPLGAVLTELGQHTEIHFTIPEEIKSEPRTLSLQQRPIEEALQQLFTGKSYSVQYRVEGDKEVIVGVDVSAPQSQMASRTLSGTHLINSGPANQSASPSTYSNETKPLAVRTDLDLLNLEQSLKESPDPATRIAALNGIAGRETDVSVNPIVVQGLSDRAPEVREAALDLLRYSSDPVPIQSLASVVIQDANPAFRVGAMSLLIDQLGKGEEPNQEDRDAVRAILQQGLADPDPRVREQAAMLLENN